MGIRHALLIGTARYRDPTLSQLRAPAQDARRLAELLRDPMIGRFDHVQVLVDARRQEIEEEIENLFADRGSDDLILLHLACHGVKNERGRLYFAAETTELSRLNSTAVSAAIVNEIMEQSRAGMKVAMLDCCFSGAYARGLAPRSATDEQLVQQVAGRGTFVMTATDALEYAYENGKAVPAGDEQSSVFTRAVIDGLATGAADLEEDGLITADELFGYVERRVRETGRQTPRLFCVNVSGVIPIAWVSPDTSARAPSGTRLREGVCGLDGLFPAVSQVEGRGLAAADWPGSGQLSVPLGIVRRLGRRDRGTFNVDFSTWAGNIGVAGVSQSGKTTLLRTLLCALALTHTPREVQAYCLDFDGDLSPLAGLPHVGGVAGRLDPALVSEIVTMVTSVADQRRERFPRLGVDSMQGFRARRSHGEFAEDPFGDVFLLIDGWPAFDRHFPGLAAQVLQLAEYGLRFGVHLAVSVPRWGDLPEGLRQRLPTRIELPLADPRESEFDAVSVAEVPAGSPGCGLVRAPAVSILNVSLPRIDGSRSVDDLGEALADLVARVDSAWQGPRARPVLTEPALSASGAPDLNLPDLLGIKDPRQLPLDRLWAPRGPADWLRAPIGVGADGEPLLLDLKEAAQGGMGPHGLVVGATGSGKSELIRALVLSLALTHPPSALNFLLASAKGGGTFLGLADLPHVAGLATDLTEAGVADRLAAAIQGELVRRQELLRSAGNVISVHHYRRARQARADLPEIPELALVIDEFSELLTAWPRFLDTLLSVGRLGRSLGMHLVLSGQRLEEGRLRGLDSHLSFRIGLRTFSSAESRAVIGVPDASELPPVPGHAYLRVAHEVTRFRGFHVSAPADADAVGEFAPTLLDVIVDGFRDHGPRARPILLPPLMRPPTLDQLLPALPGQSDQRRLLAVVGITDRPYERSQQPLVLDLSGEGAPAAVAGAFSAAGEGPMRGNAAIVGEVRSGKSTLAAALICSLAVRHSPEDIQLFLIWADWGGEFQSLADLPHTSAVTAVGRRGADTGLERRIVTECSRIIDLRERTFADAGINSFAEYLERKAQGEFEDPYGDVFVLVDGWYAIRQQQVDLEQGIAMIAQRGPAYGVHLIVTAQRWFDIRPSLREALGTTLELKLSDPAESAAGRAVAAALPDGPGHGLTADGTHFLAALPRDDGIQDTARLQDGVATLVARCAKRWAGRSAPRLRVLPLVIPHSELPAPAGEPPLRIPIGVDEELRPVFIDLGDEPHFLVYGDPRSGRTTFLRGLIRTLCARTSPDQVRILVADYRRGLIDAVDTDHVISYGASAQALVPQMTDLADAIKARMPGPDVTTDQLRSRSWWRGSEAVLLVDDYDLIAAGTVNPLDPLVELLPQAADLGLHLVLARRPLGPERGTDDRVIRRLTELETPGLLLSADRDEGMLLGVRHTIQPPGRGMLVTRRGRPVTVQLTM